MEYETNANYYYNYHKSDISIILSIYDEINLVEPFYFENRNTEHKFILLKYTENGENNKNKRKSQKHSKNYYNKDNLYLKSINVLTVIIYVNILDDNINVNTNIDVKNITTKFNVWIITAMFIGCWYKIYFEYILSCIFKLFIYQNKIFFFYKYYFKWREK